MKKVIMLSGSPRPSGNTYQVLEECATAIEDEGLEVEIIPFVGKNIRSCIACGRCGELGECSQNDGLNDIIAKIKDADGFIVGSPVYFGTARGDVMSALQRIGMVSRANDNFLSWKVGGPIAVARRGGHTATIQEMLMFFFINDMIVAGSTYWNMVFGHAPGQVQEDDEGMATIRKFGYNVATLIKKIKD